MPLALLARRYDFKGKAVVNGLLLVPLILPPFVGAIGMRQILGRFGVLTSVADHAGRHRGRHAGRLVRVGPNPRRDRPSRR